MNRPPELNIIFRRLHLSEFVTSSLLEGVNYLTIINKNLKKYNIGYEGKGKKVSTSRPVFAKNIKKRFLLKNVTFSKHIRYNTKSLDHAIRT